MNTDVPCGQWLKQESHSVSKDGLLVGKISVNNISVRTGEEFAMEFLQDRGLVRQVYNGDGKVLSNGTLLGSNGTHHIGYEELSVMLGLQRVDSVCSSDMTESTFGRATLIKPSAPSGANFVPEDSQRGKIKFICSSGGKILPRPSDGKLRYVGGETRIVSIQKNISFEEFVKRTSCNQPYTIKYRLPGEDFDALISVSSNEDLQNMIEEYIGLGDIDGSQRLRIYLIPLSESATVEADANQQHNPDFQYVVAVNGIVDHSLTKTDDARCLTNDASHLKLRMDQSLAFSQKHPPSSDLLEDNVGLNNSNVSPKLFEPPCSSKPSDNVPISSIDPVPQKDLMNGNSQLPTTLSFVPPLMQVQLESVVLQEKSVQQDENAQHVVYELPNMKQSAPYCQKDPLKRVNDDENFILKNLQAAKEDPKKNIGVQNKSKENIPAFYQVEIFSSNMSSATANGDMSNTSKVHYDQVYALNNMQILDNIIPASTGTYLKPVSNVVIHQFPAEPALHGQRTTETQEYLMNGKENGKQGSNMLWTHNHETSLSNLLSGLSDNLSRESTVQLLSTHQKGVNDVTMLISSDELHPTDSSSCFGPSMQNSTVVGFRREVSLMDDDFFTYTKQEIGNVCHEEYYNNIQKEVTSIKEKEENQMELADLLGVVTEAAKSSNVLDAVNTESHLSNAMEAESTFLDPNDEDVATDNGSKDSPFSNALIAEMEADMYGLQIIKNAELEEIRELGSGTYGTVYHGRWRGSDVAIKRIKKSCFAGRSSEEERLTNDFWSEARILSNLHHPNVVAFYGVVPDGAGGALATVTEFMPNGSLRNVLIKKDRSLDRRKKLLIVMDAAFGMEYLHSKNIVHFDLKCDNLLVNMRDPQRPVCKLLSTCNGYC
ncbi:uncharacterized protein [Rutidosis leptorrhynchoides]|uniref:uncharacterized protein isoform X2 n=1 Tax=Rutidosis leptorrhynchoides TaxID=125765 RepID=UPI003A9911D4